MNEQNTHCAIPQPWCTLGPYLLVPMTGLFLSTLPHSAYKSIFFHGSESSQTLPATEFPSVLLSWFSTQLPHYPHIW